MDLVHRPVAHPLGAQGAAVAGSVPQDPPRVPQLIAVLPHGLDDLEVVVRPSLTKAERFQARPVLRVDPLLAPPPLPCHTASLWRVRKPVAAPSTKAEDFLLCRS